MKIDINQLLHPTGISDTYGVLDTTEFLVKPHVLGDETVYLVNPQHVGVHWNKDNLIFRSSVWNAEGELISASFPKFFNWEEQIELVPLPKDLSDVHIPEKIDGSCLIFSKYKGNVIIRTRGTMDARKMDNGDEIDLLLVKYPNILKMLEDSFSLIFEWYSPKNRIVIDYGKEPTLTFIGCVFHNDYRLALQQTLDDLAPILGVPRPKMYHFATLDDMKDAVQAFRGVEGVCVYYNGDQTIKKLKGLSYLALHAFKNNLNPESIIDLWLSYNPVEGMLLLTEPEFREKIKANFDWECLQAADGLITELYKAINWTFGLQREISRFCLTLVGKTRKEAAIEIVSKYKPMNQTSYAFSVLDRKGWSPKQMKQLLMNYFEVVNG